MKNKSKLILASAVFIAALMLLVPLSQTDMSGGGGSENSTSDSVVLSANPTPDYYVSNGGEDGNNGTSEGASFKTITCAISAAINAGGGKVIKIADGTYEESLVINGNITLIGDDDPGNVIIKPSSASGSVISIGADNISLTVSGITLKTAAQELSNPTDDEELKGRGYGLTTGSYNSTVELSNVVIDGFTYGISSYGETGLTLTNSKIQNTTYKGIFAIKLASAEFTDVTFKNNATATALLPGENPNSRSGSAIDFNLTNACNHISFSRCTFDTNGDVNGSTSGAIKIKIRGGDNETESYAGSGSITNGVSISNCTFINNSRDVVLGTQQKPNSSDDFAVKYSGGSPIREYNFAETNSNATDGVKSSFFANGNKITIGVADSNSTIISWNSGSCTYSEDDAKKLAVFGGSKNADVSSSSIDMTGGKVACLYGGGYGDSSETPASVDTASIEITGGTIQVTVFGGGLGYANVDETTITISDAAISQDVVAGGASNSSAKDASGISTSVNTVTKATINISGGSVGNSATYGGVYGGGQSLAYVKSSEINVTGGSIYLLCASGSNGITGTTEMTISGDAKITYLFSVNRGVINNSEINIKSSFAGAIDKLALGALSDWDNNGQNYAQFKSGSTDGAVLESVTLTVECSKLISSDSSVNTQVFLGRGLYSNYGNAPFTHKTDTYYQHYAYSGSTLTNGTSITPIAANVTVNGNVNIISAVGTTTNSYDPTTFIIGSGKTWTIDGASLSDISKIACEGTGKLTLKNDSDFVPAPLVDKNTGAINLSYNITVEKTIDNTTICIDAKNVPKHTNGVGTSGYWIGMGLKAPANADFNTAKLITGWGSTVPSNLEWTSASGFDSHFGGETNLDYFTTYYDFGSSSNTSDAAYLLVSWNGTGTDCETYLIDFSKVTKKSSSGTSGGIVVPPVVPDEPDEPTIIPDENNNITVPEINEETTKELIHEAVSSGSNSISIIDTSDVKGEYSAVTVSKADLETIAKSIENNNNIDSVSIPTSEGNIIIEKEVLTSILESANADSVSFGVEDARNDLTEEQKKAVGDRPVYDISIKAGNENVTSFNGKTITISLPYSLKAGEDPENIVVYYVKDDASLEKINCEFKNGKVIFETDHLSKYVIAYEEQEEPIVPDDKPEDDKKESNNTIYYAVAAIVIILIIIALAYFFMKKKQ